MLSCKMYQLELRGRFHPQASFWLAWLLLLTGLITSNFLAIQASTSSTQVTPEVYELKFQVEPENSTLTKAEQQQQVFKCHVKLAPSGKTISKKNAHKFQHRLIKNLTLHIDWIRSGQNLTALSSEEERSSEFEPIDMVNVEFKTNNTGSTRAGSDKRTRAKFPTRLEIKNTLNELQSKLTSRLRINQLRMSDSGHYKCVASAHYGLSSAQLNHINSLNEQLVNHNEVEAGSSKAQTLAGASKRDESVVFVQQKLESSEATLMVTNNTVTDKEFKIDNKQPTANNIEQHENGNFKQSNRHVWARKWASRSRLDSPRANGEEEEMEGGKESGGNGSEQISKGSNPNEDKHATPSYSTSLRTQPQTKEDSAASGWVPSSGIASPKAEAAWKGPHKTWPPDKSESNLTAPPVEVLEADDWQASSGEHSEESHLVGARGKMSWEDNNPNSLDSPQTGNSWQETNVDPLRSEGPASGFEDDEDLFKLEGLLQGQGGMGNSQFINGRQQARPSASITDSNEEGEDESNGGNNRLIDEPESSRGVVVPGIASLGSNPLELGDIFASLQDEQQWPPTTTPTTPSSIGQQRTLTTNDLDNNNKETSSSSPADAAGHYNANSGGGPSETKPLKGGDSLQALNSNQEHSRKGFLSFFGDFNIDNLRNKQRPQHEQELYNNINYNPHHSHHHKHTELGCYTNLGESYRGNVSTSHDDRVCLNWDQIVSEVKVAISNGRQYSQLGDRNVFSLLVSVSRRLRKSDHNYCRNPDLDPRGPWCFVVYRRDLDRVGVRSAGLVSIFLPRQTNFAAHGNNITTKTTTTATTTKTSSLRTSSTQREVEYIRYIQRHCAIAPCSEYLWLYIVAPPLGLLTILSCLSILIVRHIRKRNQLIDWESPSSAKLNSALNRLFVFSKGSGKFGAEKFTTTINNKGNYLENDEIFEIVDDIDWSDGCNHHTGQFISNQNLEFSQEGHLGEGAKELQASACRLTGSSNYDNTGDLLNCTHAGHRSITQVGPMFATLRCHIRGGNGHTLRNQIACKDMPKKSPSTLIELSNSSSKDACSCVRSFHPKLL